MKMMKDCLFILNVWIYWIWKNNLSTWWTRKSVSALILYSSTIGQWASIRAFHTYIYALLNRVTLQKVLSHYGTKFRNKLFSNGTRSNKVTRQSCTPLAHQWQSSWSPRHAADQHATRLLTIVMNFQSNQIKNLDYLVDLSI